ncbi:MAG: PASTA domain-containing protein [Gaiellaceae bacterium]
MSRISLSLSFWALCVSVAAFPVGLSACGGGDGGASPETVTVVQSEGAGNGDEAPVEDGDIEVPDVVGMDHQLAQDTMQAAGLYNLSEEDATGQDRLMLIDRNWTVVEQDPPAGSMVSEDQTIILRSKKDDE